MEKRIINTDLTPEDKDNDTTLRPMYLKDYIGQSKIKDNLKVFIEAAKSRNELSLIEVKCSIGARDDLGRPTTTALENKENFMSYLKMFG